MEKQYRYIQGDLRADKKDNKLSGYFAVFGPEYRMSPTVAEIIDPAAFSRTLEEQPDVRCLWNHNPDIVLGRTGNGTLSLRVDDHGLFGEVTINPEDSDAMNAMARIRRGDVSQCSFGFEVLDQETQNRNGDVLFVLKDVRLWEVSPVTFPAYRDTSINARNDDAAEVKRRDHESWQIRIKEKLNGTQTIID
ncbi:MAG: HK97 family phage prohead protease [Clostridiales bacterium]|nr:HK97 family phage prohead protease [Clostridiales bacterium]